MAVTVAGDPYHHRRGARLPQTLPAVAECFRCAAVERRGHIGRVLHEYALVRGKLLGTIRLCDSCAELLTPLRADPLDVTTG